MSLHTKGVIKGKSQAAESLCSHFYKLADEVFREQYRGDIRVNGWNPVITLLGLKMVKMNSIMAGTWEVPVIEATGEMGGIRSTFQIGLDGSKFYVVDEIEVPS
jgi:hypothetical protein